MSDIIIKIQGTRFRFEERSLKKNETLNNNKNTCSFVTINQRPVENQSIEIFETTFLTSKALSGQPKIFVDDISEFQRKRREDDIVIVGLETSFEKEYTISYISFVEKSITFTENLAVDFPVKTNIGKKFFAGKVSAVTESEFSKSHDFEYNVQCVSTVEAMDREIVNETFLEKYFREIAGLVVYEFVANDTQQTFFDFETSLTPGGVALPTSDDSDDRIEGNFSQKTGTSGEGTATWEKVLPSTDISLFSTFRFWRKVAQASGLQVLSLKVRIGHDVSNYYQYDIPRVGSDFSDCWNYEAFKITGFEASVGSVNLSAITWLQIEVICSGAIADGNLKFDQSLTSTGGFTINNVLRGTAKFEDVRFRGKKPSVVFEQLTKLYDEYWYVDYDRDIHYYYTQGEVSAPYEITDTSKTYGDLVITVDTKDLVNRQQVEGSEAPSFGLYTQLRVADGEQDSRNLDFKPAGERKLETGTLQGLKAFVNDVEKTVGIENLTDESTVDFVFNYSEKVFRNASAPKLIDGDVLKLTYYPVKLISVRYFDQASVDALKVLTGGSGFYDGQIIIDKTIESFREARQRAKIEVDAKKNPEVTCTFTTNIEGLKTGQIITVSDPERNINGQYQIQKINTRQKGSGAFWVYKVTATTSLFGYVEFMQLLLKRSERLLLDAQSEVTIPVNADEVITIFDQYSFNKKEAPYKAGEKRERRWDFLYINGNTTESGIVGNLGNQLTAEFVGGETGLAGILETSTYNSGRSLRISTSTGGNGKSISLTQNLKIPMEPSTEYTCFAISKVGAITNPGTSPSIKLLLREFQSIGDTVPLETRTIIDKSDSTDFDSDEIVFTTNASTGYYDRVWEVNECICVAELGDFKITETPAETVDPPAIADFSIAS